MGLSAAVPAAKLTSSATEPLVAARGLVKLFAGRAKAGGRGTTREVPAVRGVSFDLWPGRTMALIGGPGCGKTTTGRLVVNLIRATAGHVYYRRRDILPLSRRQMWPLRRRMQIIFQDPFASLDTRMAVNDIVAEPLRMHGMYEPAEWGRARVRELLRMVGLIPEHGSRYAHQFTGGDRQRVGIARALALGPELLVLDEPVAGLDGPIRDSVVGLLTELQAGLGLTYLVMAQDLAPLRDLAHQVAVMRQGRIVETGAL
ncbi:MAG TPA: ATP-binding cassette domain-containing protein [Micromonosporaceae bacterium]